RQKKEKEKRKEEEEKEKGEETKNEENEGGEKENGQCQIKVEVESMEGGEERKKERGGQRRPLVAVNFGANGDTTSNTVDQETIEKREENEKKETMKRPLRRAIDPFEGEGVKEETGQDPKVSSPSATPVNDRSDCESPLKKLARR
ncbi:hypothetical protein PMAYCL1PPCAC_28288, partial [Pristionchus mayeri]